MFISAASVGVSVLCLLSKCPLTPPAMPCPGGQGSPSCPHLCWAAVSSRSWTSPQKRGILCILLLLQTNQDFCLSCGRIRAPWNLIYRQLPCSSSLLSLSFFLDALAASVFTSQAEFLHLLCVLFKDSNELGSSGRSAVIFIYFWPNVHSSSSFTFHLQHFCSSLHTRPRLRVCVRGIPILSQPPFLDPSISVALIPSPQSWGCSDRAVAVLWCLALCLCTHIFSGEMLSLCWMMVYSVVCAPLWFYNEDFSILNTLTLEMCCTCLVFGLREVFWRCQLFA